MDVLKINYDDDDDDGDLQTKAFQSYYLKHKELQNFETFLL